MMPPFQLDRQFAFLQQLFGVEWLQHQFQYYNIQSLNVSQEPRMASDKAAYLQALGTNMVRYWQLTNTRFIFGMSGGFIDALNQQLDPGQKRFRPHTLFTLYQKPGTSLVGVQTNDAGPFALVEFTGALPRAKLYSQWQVNTNLQATLRQLADPAFDPTQVVLVADGIAAPSSSASNAAPGTVDFASYAPKHLELKTSAAEPTVLLLNDKFDPNWKVWVDGKPDTVLRCNYIMRGVLLPPGNHAVTFRFQPPTFFWWTFSVVGMGLLLCAFLAVTRGRPVGPKPTPTPVAERPKVKA
jgi:hypothetical protein